MIFRLFIPAFYNSDGYHISILQDPKEGERSEIKRKKRCEQDGWVFTNFFSIGLYG